MNDTTGPPMPKIARDRFLLLTWPEPNQLARMVEDALAFIRGHRILAAQPSVEFQTTATEAGTQTTAIIRYFGPAIEAVVGSESFTDQKAEVRLKELSDLEIRVWRGISRFRRGDGTGSIYDIDRVTFLSYDDDAFVARVAPVPMAASSVSEDGQW